MKYSLQMSGSVGVPAVIAEIHGQTDAEALEHAQRVSKDMASARYYSFGLWDADEKAVGHWRIEMVATIVEWKAR